MKLIENGKTAVIVSPGFGAGWSTWSDDASRCLDGEIAQLILNGDNTPALVAAKSKYPDDYHEGLLNAVVVWVPVGRRFEIQEYDGSESIRIFEPDDGLIA